MKKIETPIEGLFVIDPEVYGDDRGFFYESYNADKFAAIGITTEFKQDNHSFSTAGVLRGLHFQLEPEPMVKLVRCSRGRIWDVAVDLRKDSPTYKQWFGIELRPENKKMLYIPAGFGHGFYAFEDSEMLYKASNTYNGDLDAGIAWDDQEIGIEWPIDESVELTLSEKDQNLPTLRNSELPW